MEFRTPINIEKSPFQIQLQSKILTVGSCFAQVIGQKLEENKIATDVNPFGTLFNPMSIFKLLNPGYQNVDERLFVQHQQTWFHYDFHSQFFATQQESLKELLNHNLAKIQIQQYEEPQIVRYRMGEQFAWHYDAIPKALVDKPGGGGQRIMTVLVYLNDVETGGATCFKELNLQIKPKKGKALVFFPSFVSNMTSDDRTLHAGQVTFDTKWIAQM